MNTIYKLFTSLVDPAASTVACRSCKGEIGDDDAFGRSEGVCAPCRR